MVRKVLYLIFQRTRCCLFGFTTTWRATRPRKLSSASSTIDSTSFSSMVPETTTLNSVLRGFRTTIKIGSESQRTIFLASAKISLINRLINTVPKKMSTVWCGATPNQLNCKSRLRGDEEISILLADEICSRPYAVLENHGD